MQTILEMTPRTKRYFAIKRINKQCYSKIALSVLHGCIRHELVSTAPLPLYKSGGTMIDAQIAELDKKRLRAEKTFAICEGIIETVQSTVHHLQVREHLIAKIHR